MKTKTLKYWFPLISFAICLAIYGLIGVLGFIDWGDWGGLPILVVILLSWFLILIPRISFFYGNRVIKNSNHKLIFSLINSFFIALSYAVPLLNESETYIFALVILIWSEIWCVRGIYLPEKKNKNDAEKPKSMWDKKYVKKETEPSKDENTPQE